MSVSFGRALWDFTALGGLKEKREGWLCFLLFNFVNIADFF